MAAEPQGNFELLVTPQISIHLAVLPHSSICQQTNENYKSLVYMDIHGKDTSKTYIEAM
jgi:hypothetical protein